ncbi:hypothetical protein BH09ACT9_BH09ACT9_00640 [soil metagenome]
MSTVIPIVPTVFGWNTQLQQQNKQPDEPPTPPVDPTPPVEPNPTPPAPPKPGPPPVPPVDDESTWPESARDAIKRVRDEAASARIENRDKIQAQIDEALKNGQKAWATELAKKLGVLDADEQKTPDEIIAELQAERDGFKTQLETLSAKDIARNERDAINDASKAHGGDSALVRAVIKSDDLLKDIDPAADDYAAQVTAIVKAQIEKNPKLREVQVAGRSGGEQRPAGSTIPAGPLSIEDRRKAIRDKRSS